MNSVVLIQRIKSSLQATYGNRLQGVVLYGSEARGDAEPDSDINVLALIDGVTNYGQDLRANIDALYDLSCELGRRISAKPIDAREYFSTGVRARHSTL